MTSGEEGFEIKIMWITRVIGHFGKPSCEKICSYLDIVKIAFNKITYPKLLRTYPKLMRTNGKMAPKFGVVAPKFGVGAHKLRVRQSLE